ncbi:hypothetical protein FBEOM_3817 [Fusarium beomiforme]|uniref:Uncharacterized protein n=1 Tax=Fusarium beomiforme TaxID=44412 RepID=A0A9P5E0J9_9HYPO|nr:hypothetical protein FBEOM_3817 [Fusarium beomiforme]
MAPHRTNYDSDEEIGYVPLPDISSRQLDQLTELLYMDPGVNIAMPDKNWLLDQRAGVAKLDKSNRRSTKLLDRLSAKIESLSYRLGADGVPTACLCSAHYTLHPKLIRRLMLLIIAECTEHIQVLRVWRQRIAYPNAIIAWLDRVDAVTGLWVGRQAFNATFGYERVSPTNLIVRSKCEACIMSVIGGRPQVLGDLRAALTTRRDRHVDRGDKNPRLLRLVESWISHYHADSRRAIYTGSAEISEELSTLLDTIKVLRVERPGSQTSQSSYRSGYRGPSRVYSENSRLDCVHDLVTSDGQPPRPRYSNDSQENRRSFVHSESSHTSAPIQVNEQNWMDEDVDFQASLWMDCQMQQQGLTVDERRQLFEDDMHPAFSDYAESVVGMSMNDRLQRENVPEQDKRASNATAKRQSVVSNRLGRTASVYSNPSAVPPPLSFGGEPGPPDASRSNGPAESESVSLGRGHSPLDTPRDNSSPETPRGNSPAESEWVPVSVYSPPPSLAGIEPPHRHTFQPNSGDDWESVTSTYAEQQAHIEFCQKYGFKIDLSQETEETPATPRPPRAGSRRASATPSIAASSVYSSRPGFRRSQTNVGSVPPSPAGDSIRRGHRSSRMPTRCRPGKSMWDQIKEHRQRIMEEDEDDGGWV